MPALSRAGVSLREAHGAGPCGGLAPDLQLDGPCRVQRREALCDTAGALPADLDARLGHDGPQRPHSRSGNIGRRPIETVMSFVSQEGRAGASSPR